jgi:NDP-sugar pyrophosphorylase family protein
MILAAGRGTRLAEVGLQVPKALVRVGGEPLLGRQIRYLEAQGVRRVVVNAHHLAEQVVQFVGGYRGQAVVRVVVESHLLGTAGGVRNALPFLGSEPFLVLYGDVLVDASLLPMLDLHFRKRVDATLALYESIETREKGIVQVGSNGLIKEFVEKGKEHPGRPALVNAGIYVLDRRLILDLVPEGAESDFGHDVFPAALALNRRLAAYRLPRPVLDVGTPTTLEAARELELP